MMAATQDRFDVEPLESSFGLAGFVAELHACDIVSRFGAMIDPGAVPALLFPLGPTYRPLGAWENGVLVGTAVLADIGDRDFEFAALVRSDMKQRRIGSALVHHALRDASLAGARQVIAQVRFSNKAALGLLRSAGFSPAGEVGPEMTFIARASDR